MASELMAIENEPQPINAGLPRKPRILLAASGSVAAMKFANLCRTFAEWAEIKAVATKASLHFIDKASLPNGLVLYTDEDEWSSWKQIGDSVLHIELRRWADIMVIAPLSANTLAKIAGGLCDNLLTCVVRAWDYKKPIFIAPAMNTLMWTNTFTERHLMALDELGITLIRPVSKRLACGDHGNGAMAEPSLIYSTVRLFAESRNQPGSSNRQQVMASISVATVGEPLPVTGPRRSRVLLAASGSVAAMQFGALCHYFVEWADVAAVVTAAALRFIDKDSLPMNMVLYTDQYEQTMWKKLGDSVLHIELSCWADVLVIAPASANTLGKISMGLCDNLLTCIVRAWDYKKGLFVAPAMDTLMWTNSFMEKHLTDVDDLGIVLIPPDTERSVCGERGKGAMAEPSDIDTAIRVFLEPPSSDSGSSNGMEEQS
ncbi:hypothetical protein F8388_010022 [Cannabis sativa]|uniref:phosphopantothenoylcysteine decarboxylase n=2 Tax=Cannabis sativa TaxID=3483 RepID=A0A7J6E5Z5_CANSA|nr:hypothetical protein G4B88_025276 [Cannabis sativa]KAF4348977.1 hypothetical protein G4B88_025277 [Cannabis sativa]KAF4353859.1 hypothetical protein F8388_010018 [Cannabis sativa]KAF4353861.1 hypothetical protein F8388_010020 [Cannabis sativa]KAF4353863.1 hypothetical protein F8388_010022 [Cannabis sativa]